ncbi:hypothetical protein RQP46_008611 [Phenoliferia psychrophenolica]
MSKTKDEKLAATRSSERASTSKAISAPDVPVTTRSVTHIPAEVLLQIALCSVEPDSLDVPDPSADDKNRDADLVNSRNRRSKILINLVYVSKAFRGVAEAVLYADISMPWMAANLGGLVRRLRSNPSFGDQLQSMKVVFQSYEQWERKFVERARGKRDDRRRAENTNYLVPIATDHHKEEKLDAKVKDEAQDAWFESEDGDWDARAQDGAVHGAVAALFQLAAFAPRLRELYLDQFAIPFHGEELPESNPSTFAALRSLTFDWPNPERQAFRWRFHHDDDEDEDARPPRILHPDLVHALIERMENLEHLEVPLRAFVSSTTVLRPHPRLRHLHLSEILEDPPHPRFIDLLPLMPHLTHLTLTGLEGSNFTHWSNDVLPGLSLSSLSVGWRWDSIIDGTRPDQSYTRSFRRYIEHSSLVTLRLAADTAVAEDWLAVLDHLPTTLTLLQLEREAERFPIDEDEMDAVWGH